MEKSMENKKFLLGRLAMILVFVITITGCDNSSTGGQQTITYNGFDLGGNEYTLTLNINASRDVRNGDKFTMKTKSTNGNIGTSNGTVVGIIDDTFTLKPSNGSEFDVTIKDDIISSIVGSVTLSDGTVFIVRTFNEIHMWIGRWKSEYGEEPNKWYSEGCNYASGDSIKLKDIFEGPIDVLFSEDKERKITFELTGSIDKPLKIHLRFFYTSDDRTLTWSHDHTATHHLGGGTHDSNGGMVGAQNISGDDFKVQIPVDIKMIDRPLPPGEVHLYIEQIVWARFSDPYTAWNIGEDEDKIPDNIHGIVATIRNLKVEAVSIDDL